jgi:hypothetical protein
LWFGPGFQFSFPTFTRPSVVRWELVLTVVCAYQCDAECGQLSFQPYTFEGTFPPDDAGALQWEPQVEGVSMGQIASSGWYPPASGVIGDSYCGTVVYRFPMTGEIQPKANEPCDLVVGIGIQLSVTDGCVGIPSCQEGKEAKTGIWAPNMGQVDVCFDLGEGVHSFRRYRLGLR